MKETKNREMTTYKLDNGLPAYTKEQWINYLHNLYTTLLESKYQGRTGIFYQDGIELYNKIANTFGIKLI